MLEVGRAVAECDFLRHTDLFGYLGLEGRGVGHFRLLSVHHVENGGSYSLGGDEAFVECSACGEFLDYVIRNSFSGLVVARIFLKHFGSESPVFV